MIDLIKAYFKYFCFLILLAAVYIFWQIYGDLFNSWLFTFLKMKESDLMPYFKMVLPGILFFLTFITGFNFGREYERKNTAKGQKTPFDYFLEFLDKRIRNADMFYKYSTLNAEKINEWYEKTLGGIEVGLGSNITDDDIKASLMVIQSEVESIRGYNLTTVQLQNVLAQCKGQVDLIKKFTKPQFLTNFNPLDLKRYE